MYFKKLELIGFKSFNEKTTLHFEPGITAVVGPNGCGKSNIFDSIRWVLGEQSAKSLRGSEMQDIIFNGTDSKEAVSMAEVSLTFDNENRFFNFEHPELTITRRLFRSGESEYLINKSQVRLKDILDILLGTGVGAESYSIVAQGKIDLVLSSRPEDRRLVFDEASGITKYKAQKRETIRKLEETEQNLLRVNDIVTEVKRQIGSLERQANKARRYKEVFEELKLKEINQACLERSVLLKEKEQLSSELKELEAKEAQLQLSLNEEEAKTANRQNELKVFEEQIMSVKNEILNLENTTVRSDEHIKFNQEKLIELEKSKKHLIDQREQVKARIILDEEKLANVKAEYDNIRSNIDEKSKILNDNETQIFALDNSIKDSLDAIALSKKQVLELATKIAHTKNEITGFQSKEQIFLARKKRLEIEKAKVFEEKAVTQLSLDNISKELEETKRQVEESNSKIAVVNNDLLNENSALSSINSDIESLERKKLALQSHKEFLQKLKSEYDDISESMNALIYLDKMPAENTSGLVIKIKDFIQLNDEEKAQLGQVSLKANGEAKPIELDTGKIDDKIAKIDEDLGVLRINMTVKEVNIGELNKNIAFLQQELRNREIALANKETSHQAVVEQFNKIREEEDIIVLELNDVHTEMEVLEANLKVTQEHLSLLNNEERRSEDAIVNEESRIVDNRKLREAVLVIITQTKTELEGLRNKIVSDEETLKIVQDTYDQDRNGLNNIEAQINDAENKRMELETQIKECEEKIKLSREELVVKNELLKKAQEDYYQVSAGATDALKKIENARKELDSAKNQVYQYQMHSKDLDYKYSTLKERMLQAYRIDLEVLTELSEGLDINLLADEITKLKERLDSYGSVNLVAIEEYDELKKRYDFLIQQQTDLVSAKESLHQAILKINRTTKQMFLETFEKVKEEFRNYFRLLFNGGDAQVYLIDEDDPLESGIEIICRPPGKKLQNVLLLSGGEKSMSAIALIFAIFKVKPSPFCILDEIDAALDEANVDRFSRILQEFSKTSQFIVVTHNKRTIANANVMYGITMQESGVSRIVSVKFSKDSQPKNKAPQAEVAEPV